MVNLVAFSGASLINFFWVQDEVATFVGFIGLNYASLFKCTIKTAQICST